MTTCRTPLALLLLLALAGAGLVACDDGGVTNDPDATDSDATDPDVTDPDVTDPDVTDTDVVEPGECEGQPDGTPCGDPSEAECDLADSCLDEVCVPNLVEAGAPCGSDEESACDAADTCDGAGVCAPNHVAAGTLCGDAPALDCEASFLCDGAGGCDEAPVEDGQACYDCDLGAGSCQVCADDLCVDREQLCIVADEPLTTTFAAGNNHRGNMFSIVATHDVIIERFDAHPMADTTIAVYHRRGGFGGFGSDPDGWTLIGQAAVSALPFGTPTPVPVPVRVLIPAGETWSFYVTSTNTSVALNYSNGSSPGAVFRSDANLSVLEGVGLEYPFTGGTGALYDPRVWNGVVHYSLLQSVVATTTLGYAGELSNGVVFDVDALADMRVSGLSLELAEGPRDVTVLFRRGSGVGFESSLDGWEPIAASAAVSSDGGGELSLIAFDVPVEVSEGETIAFLVDAGTDGLRTNAGAEVGVVVSSTATASLRVGAALDSPEVATIVRGAVEGTVCEP